MTKTFMPFFNSSDELLQHQLKGLQWTVGHAYEGSSFYRKKLDQAGVSPTDIQTLDDIRKLPFTQADDLREGYPFPLLSVPDSEVVRIHASSGTTGKRKILTYTQKDIDDWTHFFARCYEMAGLTRQDRVQIAVGYGVWTAGVGFQLGCEKFGAMALPVGPGNVDMQCRFLVDLQTTVMCCTASMGLLMAEEVNRRKLKDQIRLKKMIFGSERSSDAMRARIKELLDLEDMFDIVGMTELYGPGTGLDCYRHEGV
ncbi:MAG: phenylacetate--CoA ligase family protein, partial [Deltaproteobacteria bacterium]|nr:phenylacetate--CoA ligase family protein [Deltaproteobacteria bacterium]